MFESHHQLQEAPTIRRCFLFYELAYAMIRKLPLWGNIPSGHVFKSHHQLQAPRKTGLFLFCYIRLIFKVVATIGRPSKITNKRTRMCNVRPYHFISLPCQLMAFYFENLFTNSNSCDIIKEPNKIQ